MNWSRRVRKIGLLAMAGISVAPFQAEILGAGTNTVSAPSPITAYVRSAKFPIPFNLDATGALPSEVHLYVSRDNGAHWQLVARQHPTARNFDFDSVEEGTFWFATRTIDSSGVAHPSGPMTPQLRITVDASRPQVEANADADGNGQVILDYKVADASPADEGVRVEYMTDVAQSWVPLSGASQPANQQWDAGLKGRLVWMPQGTWRFAWVRLFVRDRAGNETVIERRIERPRLAQNGIQLASNSVTNGPSPSRFASQQSGALPVNALPASSSTNSTLPAPTTALPSPQPNSPQPPSNLPSAPWSTSSTMEFGSGAPVAGAYVPGQLPTAPLPTAPLPTGPTESVLNAPSNVPFGSVNPSVVGLDAQSGPALNGNTLPPSMFPPAMGSPAANDGRPRSAQDAMRPMTPEEIKAAPTPTNGPMVRTQSSISGQTVPNDVRVPELDQSIATGTPNGEELRPSRSKQFSLDYEVEAVGTRGVEDVELWGTRDHGKTWERWGTDPDKVSPFDIETTGEGIYGFRIVVVSGNGLASPRPLPGEPADVYVLVDSTAPVVRVTSAQYGEGANEGSLVIRFACSDGQLSARPISLSFADNPQGPWTTIAAGLPNTGEYIWPADPQLPRSIYLRIESTDQAGNVGMHTLDTPISVQGLAPRARIRGFSGQENPGANRAAARPGEVRDR